MLRFFLLFNTLVLFSISSNCALAKVKTKQATLASPVQTSLVIDSKTGKVLHEKNARVRIYPASLTKLMTLYLTFESLKSNKISMNRKLYVSKNAENMKPCKLGLKSGETITVREAILAVAIKSANDVATTLAENLSGSEAKFAKLMTIRAHQLGMKDTYFANPSGWHHELQKTTAVDLAKLSIALKRDFPEYYPIFSLNNFEYKGKIYNGHNKVAANYVGAEGLKTGFTIPAGYNLITAASRGNKSLVAVVTGGRSAASRDSDMIQLLDNHFGVEKKAKLYKPKKKAKAIKLVMN